MPAPVASGLSDRRGGLAPTGKRRLVTALVDSGALQCPDILVFFASLNAGRFRGKAPSLNLKPRRGLRQNRARYADRARRAADVSARAASLLSDRAAAAHRESRG